MAMRAGDSDDLICRTIAILHCIHHSTLLTNLHLHHPIPSVHQYIGSIICHADDLLVYLYRQQVFPKASHQLLQEIFIHIHQIIRDVHRFLFYLQQVHQRLNNQAFLQVQQDHRGCNIIHLVITSLHRDLLVIQHRLFISHQLPDPQN
ncbi:hypothetical protein SLEP1_g7360 [Rubroshorea leprosula]|uniref:Uncharacterized protein n=1 Tax=Rubroshorea leprosula TaxID=152421 RepID=A0AAV5I6F6_9ROSI|nr:hypothetical protein SLEP1_g7360 [Rubroshorea leprosula]